MLFLNFLAEENKVKLTHSKINIDYFCRVISVVRKCFVKRCSKTFSQISQEKLMPGSLVNKVASLQSATTLKKDSGSSDSCEFFIIFQTMFFCGTPLVAAFAFAVFGFRIFKLKSSRKWLWVRSQSRWSFVCLFVFVLKLLSMMKTFTFTFLF